MVSLIKVVSYDPRWKEMFSEEAKLIQKVLGSNCIRVHHVGSTSVPGLAAKPIIDIIVEVKKLNKVDIHSVEKLGYHYKGAPIIPFRYYFVKGWRPNRTHHIHIYEENNPEIKHQLLFRDYLSNNVKMREKYSQLKFNLAKEFPNDSKKYCKGKDALIDMIEKEIGVQGIYFRELFHEAEVDAYHRIIKEQIFDSVPGMIYDYNHPSWQLDRFHRFILYHGREVVSVGHIELFSKNLAILRGLATDTPFQNKGYASHMLKLLEKWSREQGREEIKLHSAPNAEGFYRKLGYNDVVFSEDTSVFKDVVDLGKILY